MDSRDEIKAIVSMDATMTKCASLLERIAKALESIDASLKLIQEVMNNPQDDIPTGMVVKPEPG
jgi:hypothetical protein